MSRAAIVAATLLLIATTIAHSHLSVIRQGDESAETPNASDRFGAAVASGDFNGDGYDDLATGAPGENNSGVPAEDGTVVVNFGSATGLTHVGAMELSIGAPADNQIWFGHALAAGNFNGDAYDDLAVGAPYFDNVFTVDAGKVYIYHGGPTGLTGPAIVLTQADASASVDAGDLFGWSLATGNFNADGNDDLAVGAPGENGSTGAVSFFYGASGTGIPAAGGVTVTQLSYGFTNTSSDQFGFALAACEFRNEDGIDDLAIGAPFFDQIIPTTPDAGRVLVVDGSAGGLSTTTAFDIRPETIGETSEVGGNFGYALAGGRFKAVSGECFVAIGEPGATVSGHADAGRVVLVKATAGAGATDVDQNDVPGDSPETGDRFGSVLASGRIPQPSDSADDGTQFDKSTLHFDDRDDLIVGTPLERVETGVGGSILIQETGVVTVFYGSNAFGFFRDTYYFDDGNGWHELIREPFAHFGSALAAGNFDGDPDGWQSVAIGSPDADYRLWLDEECPDPDDECDPPTDPTIANAGMVSVVAPWRMPTTMRARSAAALTCDGDLLFSVRPFDRIRTASTTKVMTMLLVSEAIESGAVDSTDTYTVPDWIATSVLGTTADLGVFEQNRVIDLMKMVSSVSANDAAYFLADIVTGFNGGYPPSTQKLRRKGVPNATVAFIDAMNAKAALIGMSSDTKFLTPAGRDQTYGGDKNRSTALDMALLGQYAMHNSALFRKTVGTIEWQIDRTVPFTAPSLVKETFRFGWLDKLKGYSSRAVGVKSGGTKWGRNCGVFAGRTVILDPTVSAASFGTLSRDWSRRKGAEMVELALRHGACDPPLAPPPPDPEEPLAKLPFISTELDSCRSVFVQTAQEDTSSVQATLQVSNLDANPHSGEMHLIRSVAGVLEPGETATLEAVGVDSHEGFVISNPGSQTLELQIASSHPFSNSFVMLDSTESDTIPAFAGPVSTPVTLTVQNVSSTSRAEVAIDALGYGVDFTLSAPGAGTRVATFNRTMPVHKEWIRCVVCGGDTPGTESTVSLSLGEPGTVTAVGDTPPVPRGGAGAIAFARAVPNPFNPATRIEYRLREAGDVTIEVFDVTGRRVTTLVRGERRDVGLHTAPWNGRDDSGAPVASGVYYYRVLAGASAVSGKLVLLK